MKPSKNPPRWLVKVFRPNGWFVADVEVNGSDALAAKANAMKKVYKMGKLAHFYTYVPVDRKNQLSETVSNVQ